MQLAKHTGWTLTELLNLDGEQLVQWLETLRELQEPGL